MRSSSKMREEITYWAITGINAYNEPTYALPEMLGGHWEDKAELLRDIEGEEFCSKAVVYLDCSVAIGGYLIQGDFMSIADPVLAGAGQIRQLSRIPSMRTNQMEIRAYL